MTQRVSKVKVVSSTVDILIPQGFLYGVLNMYLLLLRSL